MSRALASSPLRERSELSHESEVAQLEALIDHLGFERVCLLGSSGCVSCWPTSAAFTVHGMIGVRVEERDLVEALGE